MLTGEKFYGGAQHQTLTGTWDIPANVARIWSFDTTANRTVDLPDARKYQVAARIYLLNPSSYTISVRDFGSGSLDTISANSGMVFCLLDNSTANGTWIFHEYSLDSAPAASSEPKYMYTMGYEKIQVWYKPVYKYDHASDAYIYITDMPSADVTGANAPAGAAYGRNQGHVACYKSGELPATTNHKSFDPSVFTTETDVPGAGSVRYGFDINGIETGDVYFTWGYKGGVGVMYYHDVYDEVGQSWSTTSSASAIASSLCRCSEVENTINVLGRRIPNQNEHWNYTPGTDAWIQYSLALYPQRISAEFNWSSYADKGYMSFGGGAYTDEWTKDTDNWNRISECPYFETNAAPWGDMHNDEIFFGHYGGTFFQDGMRYKPLYNSWTLFTEYPISGVETITFSLVKE